MGSQGPRVQWQQAAVQKATLGISLGPKAAYLQESGPTFQSGHYNTQRGFFILLKSEQFLSSHQLGQSPNLGIPSLHPP